MKYRSMADTINEIVDCRMVYLEMDFYLLSKAQLDNLANHCTCFCNCIFGNRFVCQWHLNERKIKSEITPEIIAKCKTYLDFYCEADVVSNTVYDNRSFSLYNKMLFSSNDAELWHAIKVPRDYADVFQRYLPDINDQSMCKEVILKLLYEQGRRKRALWRNHDAALFFFQHTLQR